jgi:hypothetical protein
MNTIKFATFNIPTNQLIKQTKDVGISCLVKVGDKAKSFTIIGQRELPELVESMYRTTIQRPTGFTEVEARKATEYLNKMEFGAIPTSIDISQALARIKLARYI